MSDEPVDKVEFSVLLASLLLESHFVQCYCILQAKKHILLPQHSDEALYLVHLSWVREVFRTTNQCYAGGV